MKIKINLLNVCSLALMLFFVTSCCDYDDPTLDELRICGTTPSDLDEAMCPEGINSLSTTVQSLTISALIGAHTQDGSVTFNLYIIGETTPFRTATTNLNSLSDDLEDKCAIWVAQGWPVTGALPPSDWRAEVVLNDGTIQTKAKDFSVQ